MNEWKRDAAKLFVLAAPVIVIQVGMMMLGVVDMLMVGRVSQDALAAAALGNLWVMGTTIFGMGVIFGIDPLVSQAHGAGDRRAVALALHRGLLLAVILAPVLGAAWWFAEPVLVFFGQDPEISAVAGSYARMQVWSPIGFLGFTALRQWLQGRGLVFHALWVIIGANFLNAFLNWVLIHGNLGMPALGLDGAGIATAVTRIFMFGGLVAVVALLGLHRGAWIPWEKESFSLSGIGTVLGLGLPIGIQYSLEMWAFQIATLWAGKIGKAELGAHSIVLNLASLSFMVPLGISIGASTIVGNRIGAGDLPGFRRAAKVALALGAGVMSISAVAFLLLRDVLPAFYRPGDLEVIALASSILPIAAAFQLFDGTQVVGGAILRGMGVPRPAAVFNVVGYYVLALPLAWWMAFPLGMGLVGIWWGLALALAIIAVALAVFIVRAEPKRVVADEPVGAVEAA